MLPALLLSLALGPSSARAEDVEPLVITATRISEDVALVPAAVTVIGGEELRDRGVTDLRGALAQASGVDIAPGGDAGPSSAVPEFWGIKEFDAFLLVVDGVPWGGAFNPALSEVSLRDVERIEVLRGAAPVMYGATSFVGVIHVIHKSPAKTEPSLRGSWGSYASRSFGASSPIAKVGGLESAISVDMQKDGFRDSRTKSSRDQADWRGELATSAGRLRFGAGGTFLRQNPASPAFLSGASLSPKVPLDTNENPADAFLNEDRLHLNAGLDREIPGGTWSTLVSYAHSQQSVLRGFLTDITALPNDAHGFREGIALTDLYLDSHVEWSPGEPWKVVGGIDHLHGRGFAHGGDFDYFIAPDGSAAPSGAQLPSAADVRITDQRDYSGLYGFTEWEPAERWILEAGARLNRTSETRRTSNRDLGTGALVQGSDYRGLWHGSGSAGATFKAWSRGKDLVNLFVGYRNTFKPAAVDFGLDTPSSILSPETAESFDGGFKSRWFGDRVDFNAEVFQIDLRNEVVGTTIGGNPALATGGSTRSRGLELEGAWSPVEDLRWQAAYSLHDARLRDFVSDDGAGPMQFAGKRQPLSARNMFSTAVTLAPAKGWTATAGMGFVGSRFLDHANAARAREYATWSAGAGYRFATWELRVDGRNLGDQRPPVSASEMGQPGFYLLPARRVDASVDWKFR